MTTLTDKRCLSKSNSLLRKIEEIYARAFPVKMASEDFWSEAGDVFIGFHCGINKRPITELELDALEKVACKDFIAACVKERAR